MQTAADVLSRHRGPYTLIAFPLPAGRKKPERRILARKVARVEVEAMAVCFLSDPRDCITTVHVWSEREEQFILTFPVRT